MLTAQKKHNEIVSLRDAMDRLLEDSFIWPTTWKAVLQDVPLDIYEKGDNLIVNATLPGVKPEDVDIEVDEDVLSISSKAQEEKERKEKTYYLHEQRYGAFERTVTLPCAVKADKAEAVIKDGVLTLNLPKAEKKSKGKKIQIKADGKPAKD